jgi:hypothetical protein
MGRDLQSLQSSANEGGGMTTILEQTALHEAAHAVIQYRASGFVGGSASIIPNPSTGTLGHVEDYQSDSTSEEDLRARILSCYAGGHADRMNGCFNQGQLESDEDAAAECIRWLGWEDRQEELRGESCRLVEKHWPEIALVATELLKHERLNEEEIEIILEIFDGNATDEDLMNYRALARK